LIQELIIEGIPQYMLDSRGWVKTLHEDNQHEDIKIELEDIVKTLSIPFGNWNLYPHQRESLTSYIRGKNIVVATGTGSGKTECFLLPMLSHLHRSARRNQEINGDGVPATSGIRCLVLYPMNALVADQLGRLRKMLGNNELSSHLKNLEGKGGLNRSVRFGMYTGRTPFPGWYAKKNNKGKWDNKKNKDNLSDIHKTYLDLEKNRSDIWKMMLRKGKIPGKGFRVRPANSTDKGVFGWSENISDQHKFQINWTVDNWNILKSQQEIGDFNEDGKFTDIINEDNRKEIKWKIMNDRWNICWFMATRIDFETGKVSRMKNIKQPPFTTDEDDRELLTRAEMHQGGIQQYVKSRMKNILPYKNWFDGDKILPQYSAKIDKEINKIREKGGPPDVLVTNYSMLEYMLLRPLEHRFWNDTRNWLDEEKNNKLMLVLDEAHLYSGAMGTEVSMLIQRLRSVLGIENDKLQFILTSASLGNDTKKANLKKLEFIRLLTGVAIGENQLDMPKGLKIRHHDNIINFSIDREIKNLLGKLIKSKLGDEFTASEENLIKILGNQISHEMKNEFRGNLEKFKQQILYDTLINSDIFKKIYGFLNFSGTEWNQDMNMLDNTVGPRKIKEVSAFIWDKDIEKLDDLDKAATDSLLEVIAKARSFKEKLQNEEFNYNIKGTGTPLMPIRSHMFLRGLTRLAVCMECGKVQQFNSSRCIIKKCNSRVYELLSDRSSGTPILRIWVPIESGDISKDYKMCDVLVRQETTFSQAEGNFVNNDSSSLMLGLSAFRTNDEEQITHSLNTKTGSLKPFEKNTIEKNIVHLKIVDFDNSSGRLKFNPGYDGKQFHDDKRIIDFKKDPGTGTDHTAVKFPQFTDMETRGDDAFAVAVNKLTAAQDPIPESRTANKGRKTLIFSDGRQRAAKLAKSLSQNSQLDETRRVLLSLLRAEWFGKIPEKFRTLARLYPWMALWCSRMRINPFENIEGREDMTKFAIDQAKVITEILICFEEELIEDINKDNLIQGILDIDEKEIRRERTLMQIREKLDDKLNEKYKIRNERRDKNREKGEEYHEDVHLQREISSIKVAIEISNEPNEVKQLTELEWYEKISQKLYLDIEEGSRDDTIVKLIDECIIPIWEVNSNVGHNRAKRDVIIRRILDNQNGSIEVIYRLGRLIIQLFEKTTDFEDLIDDLEDIIELWGSLDENKSWTGILIYHVGHKYFNIERLGLGYLKLVDEPEFEYLLPRLFCDSSANDRIQTGIKQSDLPRRSFYSNSNPVLSRDGIITKMKDYEIKGGFRLPEGEEIIRGGEKVIRWLNYNKVSDKWESRKEIRQIRDVLKYVEFNEQKFMALDANKVIIEPFKDDDYNLRTCIKCKQVRLTPTEDIARCSSCKEDGKIFKKWEKGKNNEIDSYLEQRIFYWREQIRELEKGIKKMDFENLGLYVFRTEEHTAQVSEKLNFDDTWSGAELHELQFQDIPVTKGSDKYQIDDPPIDILSCTTTMEVGIDIGDLTAVALRTVPPHASNYQQRVGRAGRGSAEVSIALTYIDNASFAMTRFDNPLILVRHPSEPPRLYTQNRRILRRHVNASLFQLFFKRGEYDAINLIFEDMKNVIEEGTNVGLVESLGTLTEFCSDDESLYNREVFQKWIDEIVRSPSEVDK